MHNDTKIMILLNLSTYFQQNNENWIFFILVKNAQNWVGRSTRNIVTSNGRVYAQIKKLRFSRWDNFFGLRVHSKDILDHFGGVLCKIDKVPLGISILGNIGKLSIFQGLWVLVLYTDTLLYFLIGCPWFLLIIS